MITIKQDFFAVANGYNDTLIRVMFLHEEDAKASVISSYEEVVKKHTIDVVIFESIDEYQLSKGVSPDVEKIAALAKLTDRERKLLNL